MELLETELEVLAEDPDSELELENEDEVVVVVADEPKRVVAFNESDAEMSEGLDEVDVDVKVEDEVVEFVLDEEEILELEVEDAMDADEDSCELLETPSEVTETVVMSRRTDQAW